jgi:hypothetical protein
MGERLDDARAKAGIWGLAALFLGAGSRLDCTTNTSGYDFRKGQVTNRRSPRCYLFALKFLHSINKHFWQTPSCRGAACQAYRPKRASMGALNPPNDQGEFTTGGVLSSVLWLNPFLRAVQRDNLPM